MKVKFILFLGCLVFSLSILGQEDIKKKEVKVSPAARQTQGATFGEKVQQGTAVMQQSNINILQGMPNRISMNVTVVSQNKRSMNDGKKGVMNVIRIEMNPEGCLVVFPDVTLKVNTAKKIITPLPVNELMKVNSGLQQAGNALASGAQLVGGALPGGAIISAAVSSVSSLSGGSGGGASAAAYAATGKKSSESGLVCPISDSDSNTTLDLPDGDYILTFVLVEKATPVLKDALQSQVNIYFSNVSNVLKAKHDTAKNSINNVR